MQTQIHEIGRDIFAIGPFPRGVGNDQSHPVPAQKRDKRRIEKTVVADFYRMAQTPVQHYLPKLLERVEKGEIDPSFVITHRASLQDGPDLYKKFRDKEDGCIKVVLTP